MISTWSEWKRYPRAGRGENIEAPITPGIYEVRFAGTGALHSFGAVDHQGGRQGRGGAHDRPPRSLYERRGLNGLLGLPVSFSSGTASPTNLP